MADSRRQTARVADLEAKRAQATYTPPMIVTWIVNTDRSCDRVMVRSGPFNGCDFNREPNETHAGFEARVQSEIDLMEQEAAQ